MNLRGFCTWWERPRVRTAVLLLIAGLVLFVLVSGTERMLTGSSEFMGLREIVQVSLVRDLNHYEHIPHLRAYPPFFAIFWSPYGLLPWSVLPDKNNVLGTTTVSQQVQLAAEAAFLLMLMTAMTVWSVRCIGAACDREHEWPSCFPVLVWLLAGGLMLNSIGRCETDMFVLMLVAGAMCLLFARRRRWEAGFLLGAATALKLTPGLFGLYLLCRRRWRALTGMLVAGVLCTVILPVLFWGAEGAWERHRSWVEMVLLPVAREGPEAIIGRPYRKTNQSLTAAAVRYLSHYNAGRSNHPRYVNVADLSTAGARKVATGLKVAILLALLAAWVGVPSHCDPELERVLFALAPPAMLLISDVSVGGHFALLAVPFGVLAAYCFQREGRPTAARVSWAVLAGFLLTHLMGVRRLKEMSTATAGAVVVLGVLLYLVVRLRRRERRVEPDPEPQLEAAPQ